MTNTGSVTLSGPVVVDTNAVLTGCMGYSSSFDPGDANTCTAIHQITQADINAGSVSNTATGHASFNEEPIDSISRSVTATLQSAEPTGTEQVGGETAGPNQSATPPVTSTGGQSPAGGSSPIFGLLICIALGALGVLAVTFQRRALHP